MTVRRTALQRLNDVEFIQKKNMETIQKMLEHQTKISDRFSLLERTITIALDAMRTLSERQAVHREVNNRISLLEQTLDTAFAQPEQENDNI